MQNNFFYGIVEETAHYQLAYIYFLNIKYFVLEEMFRKCFSIQ